MTRTDYESATRSASWLPFKSAVVSKVSAESDRQNERTRAGNREFLRVADRTETEPWQALAWLENGSLLISAITELRTVLSRVVPCFDLHRRYGTPNLARIFLTTSRLRAARAKIDDDRLLPVAGRSPHGSITQRVQDFWLK